jgi:iron complex outermembrane receptor protein
MKNTWLLLTIPLFFFHKNVSGQSGLSVIQGIVYNTENNPAMFSTAVLMNKDSVFMNGTLIGEDGMFRFEKLNAGAYHIMVRNIEFQTYISYRITINESDIIDLGSIHLKTKTNNLEEVVIKGEKALVEVHSDKMVYNVSASVNATGNNALELLSKSPGIRVDMDNNIILQGKTGVQIYINGRPSRISGSDLANMLEGMQSENIESIEIISNPSARYDAEGTGGIINIVMKKSMATGFNGSLTGSYSKGIEPRANAGTNINYNGEKINFFSSLNYSDNNYTFNRNEIMLREDYSLTMISLRPTNKRGINFSGGMDYRINKEQTLSFDARVLVDKRISPQTSNTIIDDLSEVDPSEILIAETMDDGGSDNYNANLHYSFVPNRSSEFSADISFGIYSSTRDTKQPNWYYSMDTTLLRSIESQFSANTDIDLFSTQVDYVRRFGKASISSGGKYSYISTKNSLDFYNIEDDNPILDPDRSNNFIYLEKVAAAYIIISWKPTDKISMNAGVRFENTSSLGELISANPGPDDIVPRNYNSIFPNISISFDDKKKHALSLSYSRRINRPNYQNLNPFESKLSELSSWRGNPFLEPNYITNYQVSYSLMRKLVISNTFSITENYFARLFQTDGDKGTVISPQNMDNAIVNGLSVSYPLTVSKWWEFTAFFLYNYEDYSGGLGGYSINMEKHIQEFRMQNALKLPLKFNMELSFYATSPHVWRGATTIDGYYRIDLGLKRVFFNEKLLVQVSAWDIFETGTTYYYSSNYGGMVIDGDAFFDGRRIAVNASYKFGNQNIKKRKVKSSLDNELNRISE